MEKNPDPGSGMNISDHFSESLETVLGQIIFDADPDPNPGPGIFLTLDPGSRMENSNTE
jgi:hypothetical protein